MRTAFVMTTEQHAKLVQASKPVPYLVIGRVVPRSPQENANAAWQALGRELGFDSSTVKPVTGKNSHFFTAKVSHHAV